MRFDSDSSQVASLPDDLTRDYSKFTVPQLKDRCRERGLSVSGTKAVLLERVLKDVEEQIEALQATTPLSRQGTQHVYSNQLVPAEAIDYLIDLVVEYLHANGGQANSRKVGLYLSANKSSLSNGGGNGSHQNQKLSALQELKIFYRSLRSFVLSFPDTFELAESSPSDDGTEEDDSPFSFSIMLQPGVKAKV
jgi:hypothetical protein